MKVLCDKEDCKNNTRGICMTNIISLLDNTTGLICADYSPVIKNFEDEFSKYKYKKMVNGCMVYSNEPFDKEED